MASSWAPRSDARAARVAFFQAYNRSYIRTETLLEGLEERGVDVVRCQSNRRGPLRYPLALWKLLRALPSCTMVIANFRSFELLWLLRVLTPKPIIYDAHISFWQSACEERGWFRPGSLVGRILHWLDRFNCRIADHVLIDTNAHSAYFQETFGVPANRITPVYISCEQRLFAPRPVPQHTSPERVVFWSGSGIPLQGLPVVYEAFKILSARGTRAVLRVAGSSAILRQLEDQAQVEGMTSITFLGQLPRNEVVSELAAADIGLGGHYSSIPKAAQVIAGKAFEVIAMRKPAILGDSPATRELFVDGENALLCRMGSAEALADAVDRLVAEPELAARIADSGYRLYRERLVPARNVDALLRVLDSLQRSQESSTARE